jgi:hypothetical protein
VCGSDITSEAALTKLNYVLGYRDKSREEKKRVRAILSELHIYQERELESKKWSQLRVNRADKNNRKGLELTSNSSFSFRHLGKESAEISYFDIDLKNNTMVLWTDNLVSDMVR